MAVGVQLRCHLSWGIWKTTGAAPIAHVNIVGRTSGGRTHILNGNMLIHVCMLYVMRLLYMLCVLLCMLLVLRMLQVLWMLQVRGRLGEPLLFNGAQSLCQISGLVIVRRHMCLWMCAIVPVRLLWLLLLLLRVVWLRSIGLARAWVADGWRVRMRWCGGSRAAS